MSSFAGSPFRLALVACVLSLPMFAQPSSVVAQSAQAAQPAQAKRACMPVVRGGWLRLPPGKMPMMAGFGRIVNDCGTPVVIVAASSPAFAEVELHETRLVDGVSRMRHVPELRIAPDRSAVLKPGGLHLMLMRPGAALSPGSRVAITFTLADGRTLIGEFEVRKPEG